MSVLERSTETALRVPIATGAKRAPHRVQVSGKGIGVKERQNTRNSSGLRETRTTPSPSAISLAVNR